MKCLHCTKEFKPYPPSANQKFCGRSCSASFNNKNKIKSVQTRLKISASVKSNFYAYTKVKYNACMLCDTFFSYPTAGSIRKYCSKLCRNEKHRRDASARLKLATNRGNYGRGKKSYLESSFEQWLHERGVTDYLTEVSFRNGSKTYFVDFLFPNKLIIELDGTQHRNTISQDAIRDNFLISEGYKVVRITHEEYRKKTRVSEIWQLLEESNLEPSILR